MKITILCSITLLGLAAFRHTELKPHKQPNIIFILADDLGYGELGCYGQEKIRTPHLDQMAAEGMRFTRFYANTLCAPTRCSFVTGLHTGNAQVRDNYELGGYTDDTEGGQMPLAANTVTVARELKKAGYTTACIGKWGLGGPGSTGVPTQQGFDYFLGYLDQKQAHNYYPTHLWQNETRFALPNTWFSAHQKLNGNLDTVNWARFRGKAFSADTMTHAALNFIKTNKKQPFFLYLPYTLPHLALQLPERLAQNPGYNFPETPYAGNRSYLPCSNPRATYAAMISLLDAYVGAVMETLKQEGLDDNTLVVFASDNGATVPGTGGADTDFFQSNGSLRGWKGSLYEGGIRAPLIARWPGKVPAATTFDGITAIWDLFPTFCAAGAALLNPTAPLDGLNLLPAMKGKKIPAHEYLYWEVHDYDNGNQAVLWDEWKAVRKELHKNSDAPVELYRLDTDPGEKQDIAKENPEMVQKALSLFARRKNPVLKEWKF